MSLTLETTLCNSPQAEDQTVRDCPIYDQEYFIETSECSQ